jgi:GntR family transcriptional regulator/MocR family aminotransferase
MPRSRTSSSIELLLTLRRELPTPIHRQLEHELRDAVRAGRLRAGSVLPSTRQLAEQLDVSRGVVVEAYEQLVAEGYLTSRPGGATHIASVAAGAPSVEARPPSPEPSIDFRYGRPDVSLFPRNLWLRSLRRVLNEAPSDRLNYLDPRGAVELRDALAAYLSRVRGTAASADRIVISTGFAQALMLVSSVLKASGARRLGLEDPSETSVAAVARSAGLDVVGIPVDETGLCVDALDRAGVDAVIVTAAHQFPTGAVLPPERRAALVAWAARRNALIIEDDYDAEFRYDREPIGAIQGLAPDRVIYAGSASKTLAPGLRLGWLLVPAALVEDVGAAKQAADRGSPALDQLAFADFLSRGEFDHHLRRMRPIYRRRRDVLLRSLAHRLPELRPVGASAGLHVLAWLPNGLTEAAVIEASAALGVAAYGLAPYRMSESDGPEALLFGYSHLAETAIEEGVRLLAVAIHSAKGLTASSAWGGRCTSLRTLSA